MGKRKKKIDSVSWEDVRLLIGSFKRILESDIGNRPEDCLDCPDIEIDEAWVNIREEEFCT